MRVRAAAGLDAGHLSRLQRIGDVEDSDAIHAIWIGWSRATPAYAPCAASVRWSARCRLTWRPWRRRRWRSRANPPGRWRRAIQPTVALHRHEGEVAPHRDVSLPAGTDDDGLELRCGGVGDVVENQAVEVALQ